MKLYIPVEAVKTENIATDKPFKLSTSTKEEFKSDDMLVLDGNTLLKGLQEQMESDNLDEAFVNKLLKLIMEDENFHPLIIQKGLDLATKCTEDPEKALFVAAKKMWASIDRY